MGRSITVTFKGGPLGGETQALDYETLTAGRRLRVPARVWTGYDVSQGSVAPLTFNSNIEEYEIRPSYGYPHEYEGLWVHPQQTLIRENERLKRELAQLEEARTALDALRKLAGLIR